MGSGQPDSRLPRPPVSGEALKHSPANAVLGGQVGDNWPPENKHEPRQVGLADPNPDGGSEPSTKLRPERIPEADAPVNLTQVEERFQEATRARLKSSVQKAYLRGFRRFAKAADLCALTRRQLASAKGKQLVLRYLEGVPRTCWRYELIRLRSVWENGLRLAWPINNRRDLGRLPKPARSPTPSDDIVQEWAAAVAREKDPYLRLVWLLIAQTGWRPSHATGVRWSDVRYDPDGKLWALLADGARGEFKTYSPVAVRLAADLARALVEWQRDHPAPHPENWILPFRYVKGTVQPDRRIGRHGYMRYWLRLRTKYALPPLRPKDMRHWVSTACRKAGLSRVATAYLQGHDSAEGGTMRDWYDNPHIEDILDEQESVLPNGPLGTLVPPEVKLVSAMPEEAVALLQAYLTGDLGTMEYASRIESVRAKNSAKTGR